MYYPARILHNLILLRTDNTSLYFELRRDKGRHLNIRVITTDSKNNVLPISSWHKITIGKLLKFNNISHEQKTHFINNQQYLIYGGKYVSRETF